MNKYTIKVQHSPATISSMSYVQYVATHKLKNAVQVLTAILCLLLGTRLVWDIQPPVCYLFTAYGCFAILFLNLPAKWRSEKIVKGIQASKRPFPCSIFHFDGEKEFYVTAKGFDGPGETYAFEDCHRLVQYKGDLYYFINRDAAFLFPAQSLDAAGVKPADFKTYLESRTKLRFTQLDRGWNTSLRSLLHSFKNTR